MTVMYSFRKGGGRAIEDAIRSFIGPTTRRELATGAVVRHTGVVQLKFSPFFFFYTPYLSRPIPGQIENKNKKHSNGNRNSVWCYPYHHRPNQIRRRKAARAWGQRRS